MLRNVLKQNLRLTLHVFKRIIWTFLKMCIFFLRGLKFKSTIETTFFSQTFCIMIYVIPVSHLIPNLLAKIVSAINHDRINDLSSQSINRLRLVFRIALRTAIFLLAPVFIALLTCYSCFTVLA